MADNDLPTKLAPATLKPCTIDHQLLPGSEIIVSVKQYDVPPSKLEHEPGDEDVESVTSDHLVWDDDADPDNPRNWPQWQRIYGTAIPALQLLIITMALSSYVPAMPGIQEHFGISYQVTTLGLSLYLLGLGIGPLPVAPLSELFGRRPFYCYGLPLLLLFTIGSAAAQSIGVLLACRSLGALLGSGALSVIGGTVLDIWDIKKGGALAACIATLTPLTGPVLGPVAATYVIADRHNDWRYGLWLPLFIGTPIVILSFLLRESYEPQILKKRAQRRGIAVRDKRAGKEAAMHVLHIAFTRPVHMLLTEPLVLLPAFFGSFTYFLLISFLGSYPYVFEAIFHFHPKSVSLAFLGVMVGLFFGIFGYIACAVAVKKRALAGDPIALVPEAHLRPALIGSVLLPISLLWFAWTSIASVHWIAPVLAGTAFGAAMVMIYFTVIVYMAHIYPPSVSASSLAAVGLLRYLLSAFVPHLVLPMYERLGATWAGSVFAFISLALFPLPWAFRKWGRQLRKRSHYETSRA